MLAMAMLLLLLGGGAPQLPAQEGPPAAVLEYGPLFQKFLKKNPSFAVLLKEKRYQEAAERLDRWAREQPEDVEIVLARAYLFLEEGRLGKALKEALAYRGPDPNEILHRVALSARERAASGQLDAEARARLIDLALQAENRAIAAREQDEALRVSGDVTRPEKISGAFLDRHEESLRVGASGTVILEATIDEQGNVQDARVRKGVHEELDRKALENIRTWKFKPATLNGKPVKVFYAMTMNFG